TRRIMRAMMGAGRVSMSLRASGVRTTVAIRRSSAFMTFLSRESGGQERPRGQAVETAAAAGSGYWKRTCRVSSVPGLLGLLTVAQRLKLMNLASTMPARPGEAARPVGGRSRLVERRPELGR